MKKPGIRSNKTNHTNGAGLTLVELLVVISIMMIMTAVVFVNYRPGNQQLALNRSASKLAQDIRRAQEMAMSSTECPLGTGCAGQVPPRYGIYIESPWDSSGNPTEPDSYILFADTRPLLDGNGCFNNMAGIFDEIINNITFESDVYLSDIIRDDCGDDRDPEHRRTHLVFRPPDPENGIQFGTCNHPQPIHETVECSEITLILQVGDSFGPTKSVIINNAGLIYVE